jgi:dihydrofolate reductase
VKVQYYTAATLDGFIADASHSLEWLFQFEDLENTSYPAFIAEVGAIAMGSSTYEWLLRNHVFKDPERPEPWPYELPCWVFTSRSLQRVDGGGRIEFVAGSVAAIFPAIRDAAGGKNVWVAGGGDLAGQFHDAGHLDEMIVQLTPVTLGAGAPLFPRRVDVPHMRVTSVHPYASGMIEVRLELPREGA